MAELLGQMDYIQIDINFSGLKLKSPSQRGNIYINFKNKEESFGKQSLNAFHLFPGRQQYKHFNTR